MENSIRSLEDKIQSSKTTFKIYTEEIKEIEKKLKKKGITAKDVEKKLDVIIEEIEELSKREKVLVAKIKKGIEKIERRFT